MIKNKKTFYYIVILFFLFLLRNLLPFIYNKNTELDKHLNTEEKFYTSSIVEINTYEDFESVINQKTSFIILGQSTCDYCNRYIKTIEKITLKKNVTFYYVNFKKIDTVEKTKILNSKVVVPQKCNDYGEDIYINKSFSIPMTLVLKNGGTIDCIRGYKDSDIIIEKINFYI